MACCAQKSDASKSVMNCCKDMKDGKCEMKDGKCDRKDGKSCCDKTAAKDAKSCCAGMGDQCPAPAHAS